MTQSVNVNTLDAARAYLLRHDQMHLSAGNFLVRLRGFKQLIGREARLGRQVVFFKCFYNYITATFAAKALVGCRSGYHRHADGNCVAVVHGVAAAFFNGVTDAVSEVQKHPRATVKLVLVDNAAFYSHAACYDRFLIGLDAAGGHRVKQLAAGQNAVLHYLCAAAAVVGIGQGLERVRVAENGNGLIKAARLIFAGV